MKDVLEKAIIALAKKAESADKSDEAMRYAQSTLNLAHALATIKGAEHN